MADKTAREALEYVQMQLETPNDVQIEMAKMMLQFIIAHFDKDSLMDAPIHF
jgi:hypothetical protein